MSESYKPQEMARAGSEFGELPQRIEEATIEVNMGVLKEGLFEDAIKSQRVPTADLGAFLGHYKQIVTDTYIARVKLNDIGNEATAQGIKIDLALLTDKTKPIAMERIALDPDIIDSFDSMYFDLGKNKFEA